ncbi:MAG: SHOCT domain-containing protein, partial [Haliscomenobacter sp.]
IQPEFAAFVANGYRRKPVSSSGPGPAQGTPSGSAPVIDELFQLGELMEKGLISEEEFRREKEKLLRK